jgi:predicted cupin superfamily sugar epimerase
LKNDQFSAFHRIKSDEIWHYYTGTSSIELFVFNNLGNLEIHKLGQDIAAGEVFQFVIPAGYWFAAKLIHPRTFALIGCTVSPGFEFEDFELAKRRELTMTFPQHKKLIEMLSYS